MKLTEDATTGDKYDHISNRTYYDADNSARTAATDKTAATTADSKYKTCIDPYKTTE